LVVVAADLEVALDVAVFRRSGLRTTGMPKRGQHYVGALQTKKERPKKGVQLDRQPNSRGRIRNEDGKKGGDKRTPCSTPRTRVPGEIPRAFESRPAPQT